MTNVNEIAPDRFNFTDYRMPAEWEPHERTWLAWPHNEETWPEGLDPVREAWLEMIVALGRGEKVGLLVNDSETGRDVEKAYEASGGAPGQLEIHCVETNDAWLRDSGPIYITSAHPRQSKLVAHDFIFNSWGEKYGPWDSDDVIPRVLGAKQGIPVIVHDMVLEGGSIEVNGMGTVLTTEQCLLNDNRNPGLSQVEIEQRLKTYLGVRNVLWLQSGIEGDDTDGHIDDIARFVNPTTIVAVRDRDPNGANHEALEANWERLNRMRDQNGERFRVIELPVPEPFEGPFGPCPASYANFLIGNDVVLVPVFDCDVDARALEVLRSVFEDREVKGILCREVVKGLGAIHCVTQQEPKLGL